MVSIRASRNYFFTDAVPDFPAVLGPEHVDVLFFILYPPDDLTLSSIRVDCVNVAFVDAYLDSHGPYAMHIFRSRGSQQVDNSEALQDDPDFAVALENIQLQGLHFSCGDVLQRLRVGIYTAVHLIPDAVVLDECGGRLQLFGVEFSEGCGVAEVEIGEDGLSVLFGAGSSLHDDIIAAAAIIAIALASPLRCFIAQYLQW